jgi:hypothetical protein
MRRWITVNTNALVRPIPGKPAYIGDTEWMVHSVTDHPPNITTVLYRDIADNSPEATCHYCFGNDSDCCVCGGRYDFTISGLSLTVTPTTHSSKSCS